MSMLAPKKTTNLNMARPGAMAAQLRMPGLVNQPAAGLTAIKPGGSYVTHSTPHLWQDLSRCCPTRGTAGTLAIYCLTLCFCSPPLVLRGPSSAALLSNPLPLLICHLAATANGHAALYAYS